MDRAWKHDAKWKRPLTYTHFTYCMILSVGNFQKKNKSKERASVKMLGATREMRVEGDSNTEQSLFGGDEKVLDLSVVIHACTTIGYLLETTKLYSLFLNIYLFSYLKSELQRARGESSRNMLLTDVIYCLLKAS